MKNDERNGKISKVKPSIVKSISDAFPQNPSLPESISAIYDLFAKKSILKADLKAHELGIEFLNEASRDIRSCKILRAKKQYAHSAYHLQQAAEKAIKGYVILEGFYKSNELKDLMTHESPIVALKALFHKTGVINLANKLADPTMITQIKTAEAAIGNEVVQLEIARFNQSQIRGYLSEIKQYQKTADSIEKNLNDALIKSGFKPITHADFKRTTSLTPLIIISMITFPHWVYTRYPDGKMTPREYTRNLGIIRDMGKILNVLEREISNIIDINTKLKK